MKQHNLLMVTVVAMACLIITACSKGGSPDPNNNNNGGNNSGGTTTTGNTTNYNGYIVKTVGITRVMLGVDNNFKLTTAYLYGGGNKIVLKAGTGNQMQLLYSGISTCPDAVTSSPDGSMLYENSDIDNGKMLDTTGTGTVIKLKGFDKSKTGYNQLNIVLCKFLWPSYQTGGYYNNITFTRFQAAAGKKNADYGTSTFISGVFSGNVNVADVELADPVSDKTYITEDQVVTFGQSTYGPALDKAYGIDLTSHFFRFLNNYQVGVTTSPVAQGLTLEWVNADNGTVTLTDKYTTYLKFSNIMTGGNDIVVLPSDTASKVFLRVKGFDRKVWGFNQLRLFIANEGGTDEGQLQTYYSQAITAAPSFQAVKKIYAASGQYCILASPLWPHY